VYQKDNVGTFLGLADVFQGQEEDGAEDGERTCDSEQQRVVTAADLKYGRCRR
jgi:hypothetical protein